MDVKLLMDDLRTFASEREWERYHTPKNLSMAVACEAAELMELFQWLTPEESEAIAGAEDKMEAVRDEMADILIYLLRLADILQVDLGRAVVRKMDKNAVRFPTTARG